MIRNVFTKASELTCFDNTTGPLPTTLLGKALTRSYASGYQHSTMGTNCFRSGDEVLISLESTAD